MSTPKNIGDLPAGEWLEDKGQFTRVATETEESVGFCTLCGSLDVDAHEGVCFNCGEDSDEYV